MRLRVLAAIVVVVFGFAAAPSAQRLPPGATPTINHDFAKLSNLAPGTPLDVNTVDGVLLVGKFVSADADSLTLKVDLRLETVKRDNVAHVDHLESNSRRYALLGAAAGALAGMFLSAPYNYSPGQRSLSLVGGAATGALAGALTGSQRRSRAVLYQRR